jgi:hypothetical protein
MKLRIRRLDPSEFVAGHAYLYVGEQTVDTPAVLEFFGEIWRGADEEGPTLEGWQAVPIVEAVPA